MKPTRNRIDYGEGAMPPEEKHKPEKFYMCLVDGAITGRHYDYDEARKAAERIARREGKGVILLEAIRYCHPVNAPVEWVDME